MIFRFEEGKPDFFSCLGKFLSVLLCTTGGGAAVAAAPASCGGVTLGGSMTGLRSTLTVASYRDAVALPSSGNTCA